MQHLNRYNYPPSQNLYVKNLDDSVNDEILRRHFSRFGPITSAKVMMENNQTKGYGFVSFMTADDATRAMNEMNGRLVGSKFLYVAYAQRRPDYQAPMSQEHEVPDGRRQQLNQFVQSARRQMPAVPNPQTFYSAVQMAQAGETPRRPAPSASPAPMGYGFIPANYRSVPRHYKRQAVMSSDPNDARPIKGQTQITILARPSTSQASGTPFIFEANLRSAPDGFSSNNGATGQQPIRNPDQEPLSAAMFAAASPQEQKQMLRDRLYPKIQLLKPDLATTITNMILELDNLQLLNMLECNGFLKAKVDQIVDILMPYPKN